MAKNIISEYPDELYAGIHDACKESFAVSAVSIEHTHAIQGGKDGTMSTITICIGKGQKMTLKASFSLHGKCNEGTLGSFYSETLDAAGRKTLGLVFFSEMLLLAAAKNPGGVNARFDVSDDSDRASIMLDVRGVSIVGNIKAVDTLALARAQRIGVGTNIFSLLDPIVAALILWQAKMDAAAKKAA